MVLEASGVWHLTSFELVLSIKSIFIRLGLDWFVLFREGVWERRGRGDVGPMHGEMEKVERKGSLATFLSMRFPTLHLCQFGLKNLKILVA